MKARAVVLLPAILIAMFAYACLPACGASSRTKVLRANLVALNAANDTMLVVSKEREAQIIASAKTEDEGHAKLAAWRATIDKVQAAIDVGYRAIYSAALLDDKASSANAHTAVLKALSLLEDLKGKSP